MAKKLQYRAEIEGDRPPFKWRVFKPGTGFTSAAGKKGEANTYAEALFEATQAARVLEAERRHRATVRKEIVLEVDETIQIDDSPDLFDPQIDY